MSLAAFSGEKKWGILRQSAWPSKYRQGHVESPSNATTDKEDAYEREMSPRQLSDDAEAQLARTPRAETPGRSPEALLHELHEHQIELEMQNESLRQAQIALEESREHYMHLYEFAPVGYLTLSDAGLITQINLTGATMLGVERKKLINHRPDAFIVATDRERWQGHFVSVMADRGRRNFDLTFKHPDGSVSDVHLDCLHLDNGDARPTLRVTLTDISERKQFEHMLQERSLELESARVAAEKANLAKSEFLASMSHELRTPLNAVLGFAQLMEAGTPPPSSTQKPKIDQILKAGWHLLGLINEILDLAKIESGKVTVSHEPMSLSEVLKDCQAMIEPQAQQRGINVTFPCLDKPFYVHGDRTGVKQVMINLLSNAIKYNRVGGAVTVQCVMSGERRLRVGVEDTGSGLAPEQLAQLFQPFNRLGRESGPEEGTGIGLVVTKQLVELMGGVVGVESSVGVGSVFWFELAALSAPRLVSGGIAAIDPNERDQVAEHAALPQRTLLYVEDNPSSLALVEELIARRSDLKLLTAIDGHLGIQLARAYRPDVILMDLNLPDISGYDALAILRDHPATRHIPVMALSARALPRDIEKGMEVGFFRYLTKPIKIIEFLDALDATLRHAVDRVEV